MTHKPRMNDDKTWHLFLHAGGREAISAQTAEGIQISVHAKDKAFYQKALDVFFQAERAFVGAHKQVYPHRLKPMGYNKEFDLYHLRATFRGTAARTDAQAFLDCIGAEEVKPLL